MSATYKPVPTGSYLMPSLEHATVSDAMRPGVMACDPEATMTEVARTMSTQHIHCVVVTKPSDDPSGQAVWGLISDLDLLRSSLHSGPDTTAAACVQGPVLSVTPTMALREAAEIMIHNRVSHLLVMDPATQRPTGVLSTSDMAGVIAWGEA